MNLFEQLNDALQQKWQDKGFERATDVQNQCFNHLLAGQDVVAMSPTGTGKTLAYVLPMLQQVQANGELQALVLAPSQELAQQIGTVIREWSQLQVQVITGGANLARQIEQLKKRPEIIVGTPGRLHELSQQSKKIKFHQLKMIVLDEADYLLTKEHLPTIRELVKKAPSRRQLAFFSATSSDTLAEVSKWFNTTPIYINIDKADQQVVHAYIEVEKRKRSDMLRRLAYTPQTTALVFVKQVNELLLLAEKMVYERIPVAVLHSDAHHIERKKAIDALKAGSVHYLLTTDVAARGLDIDDLPCVIHYDLAADKEQYTHRSGRTGRMGKAGLVLSLVATNEQKYYQASLPAKTTPIQLYAYAGELVSELPKKIVKPKKKK